MRKIFVSLIFMLSIGSGAFSTEASASSELTIANAYPGEPPCQVMVPATPAQCTQDGCSLKAPAGSSLKSILINFGCAPASAPTGFENPPPDVKIHSFQSKNARGYFSEIDTIADNAADRTRELNFCLYGQKNNFCGTATVFRLRDGTKANGAALVKSFMKEIEIQDPVK